MYIQNETVCVWQTFSLDYSRVLATFFLRCFQLDYSFLYPSIALFSRCICVIILFKLRPKMFYIFFSGIFLLFFADVTVAYTSFSFYFFSQFLWTLYLRLYSLKVVNCNTQVYTAARACIILDCTHGSSQPV